MLFFDASLNTPEGDELEILGMLIDNYENIHSPIELPDPIEAIKFRMDQLNYSNKDLAQIIGLKSRISEILNKKRKLSINMIRKPHIALNISSDILVQKY
jgi:HTH-type transcriptional regulator/antitoxin HigA